jgi:multiple RNA-binding domain-containing protein 1
LDYLKSKVATLDDDELEREANGESVTAPPVYGNGHGDDDDDDDRAKRRAAAKLKRKGKAVDEPIATNDDDGEQPLNEQSDDITPEAAATEKKSSKKSILGTGPPPPLPPADVAETARLFLRNLPYTVTDEQLQDYFGRFGDISEVFIHMQSIHPSVC